MNIIDNRIISFIKEHHILTLATSNNNKPWCASCFYVYIEDKNMFIVTSDFTTKHIKDVEKQNIVAGSIALETTMIGKIQGIQFTGIMKLLSENDLKIANKAYINKFPFAILKETTLWGIFPDFVKMTHNRLGFGKKLIWNK